MAHRTQLHLDDADFAFIKELAQSQGKSIAQLVRDWIAEKRDKKKTKNFEKDPLFKLQGFFNSGVPDMAAHFDDYLYGDKK